MFRRAVTRLQVWHKGRVLEFPRGELPKVFDTLFIATDGSVYEAPVEGVDVGVWIVHNDNLSRARKLARLMKDRQELWGQRVAVSRGGDWEQDLKREKKEVVEEPKGKKPAKKK
eukprot:TRINITY_DN1731_c0_g1_i1.p2 TRINITY_DN1731_c0_g1~~TRINITY_DN1731_c0_g1_i1.p2  ORF type:complete len:114 (+),score=25.16 TRINITY_DN1731_c0_g1_i1:73-414(+)